MSATLAALVRVEIFGLPLAAADFATDDLLALPFVAAAALVLTFTAPPSTGVISPLLETVAMISGSTLEVTRLVAAGLMAVGEREGAGIAAGAVEGRLVGWPRPRALVRGLGGEEPVRQRTGTRGLMVLGDDSQAEGQPRLVCRRGRMGA